MFIRRSKTSPMKCAPVDGNSRVADASFRAIGRAREIHLASFVIFIDWTDE